MDDMRVIKASARRIAQRRGHSVTGQRWHHYTSTWATLECRSCRRQIDVHYSFERNAVCGYAAEFDCEGK